MPTINGIPPHDIMQAMPMAIMAFMALQRSVIMSMAEASIGIILITMPSLVISQVIRHIMGMAIIGIPIMPMPPIMPGIMPPPIMPGIMPPIMPGIMPPMGIGIGIIIGMPPAAAGLMPPIIGIADMGIIVGSSPAPRRMTLV
jgi:hypothetical protein